MIGVFNQQTQSTVMPLPTISQSQIIRPGKHNEYIALHYEYTLYFIMDKCTGI